MRLYTYFHSSAAYRVRIALNLKGLQYHAVPVHLLRKGGEQLSAEFALLNPARLVPVLEDGGATITQSIAIIEYLEETHPQPPLLPAAAAARARVRSLALDIACDIHPLNNLRVRRYLSSVLGLGESPREEWIRHWIAVGFEAIERKLAADVQTGSFCHGESPTLADCCLVPQIFNGKRFDVDFGGLTRTMAAFDACMRLLAFQRAQPSNCPDSEA